MTILSKPGVRAGVALLSGLGSVLLSYGILGYFGLVIVHYIVLDYSKDMAQTGRSLAFELTQPSTLAFLLVWIGMAAAAGGLGCWLVRPGRSPASGAMTAAAAWFAQTGLQGAAIDALLVALLLGYRWLTFT
jgi:hypothetical protein